MFLIAKDTIEKGKPAIFHCRAGVHRAAITVAKVLMFGLGIPFDDAWGIVAFKRRVKIDEIMYGWRHGKPDPKAEKHEDYVYLWEDYMRRNQHVYAFQCDTPYPKVKFVECPDLDFEDVSEFPSLAASSSSVPAKH